MTGLNEIRKLFFVGDTAPSRPFKLGQALKRFCLEHDLKAFNLEGAFSELRRPLFKAGSHILLEPKYFRPVAECFNVATLANNHVMDFGAEGLRTTIKECKETGILTVGAGLNIREAFSPLDTANCRIISVAEREFGAAGKDKAGVATVDRPLEIHSVIKQGRQAGKFVVVVAHGGTELIPIPPPYLRQRYKLWIEYGADLVIGNHPHVVQGFQSYKSKVICYSLGNFVFFDEDSFRDCPNARWSIAVSVDISEHKVTFVPVHTDENAVVEVDITGQYAKEFERLCGLILSDNYAALYNQIASRLYELWYDRFSTKDDADSALVLNCLRCDAHRNLIQTALAQRIGEVQQSEQTNFPLAESRV